MTTDVGVIVGRFQVPELHTGHRDLIDQVFGQHRKVVIVLGVSPALNTIQNPLDFEARSHMLREAYPKAIVLGLPDVISDSAWSEHLDNLVQLAAPMQTATLYGGRDSFIAYYTGRYPTHELFQQGHFSGTEIRNMIRQEVRGSADFRAGVVWASANRFPATFPTVDIAIMNSRGSKVLLGQKDNEEAWRFIGGFAEPESPSYEHDAIREAKEETGLDVFNLAYIGSYKIDDWRYKGEVDKIKTLFFVGATHQTEAFAGDDIKHVNWFPLKDIKEFMMMPNHWVLAQALLEYYGR